MVKYLDPQLIAIIPFEGINFTIIIPVTVS